MMWLSEYRNKVQGTQTFSTEDIVKTYPGFFLTYEGPEGSGKTTQVNFAKKYFETNGFEVLTTREPGGTPIGGQARAILLNPDNEGLTSEAELFLYAADRTQHVTRLILPTLQQGKIVLCDRYADATMAYQGHARGIHIPTIEQITQIATFGLKPDLTLLFDLPPEVGLKRAWKQINSSQRTNNESRFEREALEFHNKVRQGYLTIQSQEPNRVHIIDAEQDIPNVSKQLQSELEHIISCIKK